MIMLAIFVILTPIALTPWIHGTDGVGYYVYIRSAVINHNLDFADEYAHYSKIFPYIWYTKDSTTGAIINQYLVGTSLAWAPFFILGHAFAILLGYPRDGYSAPYVTAVSFGSSLYGFLGILLAYKFSKRYFPTNDSFLSAIGVWLASSLPYYMWLDPSMSHAVSSFLVSLFLYVTCVRDSRHGIMRHLLTGFSLGLLVITRPEGFVFVVIPCFLYFREVKERVWSHRIEFFSRNNFVFISSLLLSILPQFVVWEYLRGTFFPAPVNVIWTADTWLFLPRVFVSPLHGLFYWTPVTLFAILGAFLLTRTEHIERKMLGIGILVSVLIQAILINGWYWWYAPYSYGQRFFLNATAPFVGGLACFLTRVRVKLRHSWPQYALVIFLITWNFGLMIQFGIGMIGPNDPVSLLTVVYNDFRILPRIWEILITFLRTRMGHAQW